MCIINEFKQMNTESITNHCVTWEHTKTQSYQTKQKKT